MTLVERGPRWLTPASAAVAIVGLFLAVQLAGLSTVGLTDDDDFYIPAGISYARWLGGIATFDEAAWSRAGIDGAFQINREHPPLAKYVFGICHFAGRGVLGPADSARVGTVLFATLAAVCLMVLTFRHLGPRRGLIAGGFAVLALLTLPRFYFHSHAATLDVPVAAMYLAAATLALLGERSGSAAIWAGVVFGLATATKLNGPFLIVPYLLFAGVVRWNDRSPSLRNRFSVGPSDLAGTGGASPSGDSSDGDSSDGDSSGRGSAGPAEARVDAVPGQVRLPRMPLALVSMVVIGPLVFFASWPWMWFDTVARVHEYVRFHLHHYGIYFLYFGRVYDQDPFAPWHAPFTMAAVTVPVAVSVLALIGVASGFVVVVRRLRASPGPDSDTKREGDLVLTAVLHAFATIGVVAVSGGPKYGGAKLFMPFFPFWCLLAGYGVLRLIEAAKADKPAVRWLPAAAGALAIVASSALQVRFGGYALSQYNALTGGLRGATAIGFERQYYDIAFRDLVRWLNRHAPPNARVHFLPNNKEYVRTYRWYHRANELREDVRVVSSPASAQLLVLTHERRFSRYGEDLRRLRGRPVLAQKVIDGVPLWTVFDLR